jgi:hypothetical protein
LLPLFLKTGDNNCMIDISTITLVGHNLIDQTTQPIPRWRILRDVLRLSMDDPLTMEAKEAALQSRWVTELRETQLPDGSWGRFHSRDSSLKQRFPTTELAIRRALALGMDANDPLLKRSLAYIRFIMDDQATWTDPPEKHEGWSVNTHFITAATLLLLNPNDVHALPVAQTWREIVSETFASGSYSPQAEREAHLRLNGINTRGKYLKLAGLYPLLLLSSDFVHLSLKAEEALLDWIWTKPDGIYYVYCGCLSDPPALKSPHFIGWLEAINLFSRFEYGRTLCRPLIDWLWNQRDSEGLWDFGPTSRDGFDLPLSENWQQPINRKIDCSVLALSSISKLLAANPSASSQRAD